MNKEHKKQSFEYGAAVLLIATVLSKIIGALFKIPLNNLLGDLGFGYYSSAYDLYYPIYGISLTGLPVAVSQMVSQRTAQKRFGDAEKVFAESLRCFAIAGVLLLAVTVALSGVFVKLTDPTGNTRYGVLAVAPAMLMCFIVSAYRGYFEGMQNMTPVAVTSLVEALCKLCFGYTFAAVAVKSGKSASVAAAAAIIGVTLGTLFGAVYMALYRRFKGGTSAFCEKNAEKSAEIRKALFLLAVPVVIGSLVGNLAALVDVVTVKWQLGRLVERTGDSLRTLYASSVADYEIASGEVLDNSAMPTFLYGIRSKAYTIFNLVPTLAGMFGVSAIPVLSGLWSQGADREKIKKCIDSVLRLSSLAVLPAGIGMAALSPQIMALLYNSAASVEIGAPMLAIYGISAIFAGLSMPLISMLQAVGKEKLPVINLAFGMIVKIMVNLIAVGIERVNVLGAAYGTLFCFAFLFVLNYIGLVRATNVKPNVKGDFLKPLAAALLCGAAAYIICLFFTSSAATVVAVVAAVAVYAVAVLLFGVITEEDILNLPRGEKMILLLEKAKKHK